jgi:hypothetical protein
MALSPACTCLSCPAHSGAVPAGSSGAVPGAGGDFAEARRCFENTVWWLAEQAAGMMTHAALEEELGAHARELTRQLYQDHLICGRRGKSAAPR